jgi:hypothetical protein
MSVELKDLLECLEDGPISLPGKCDCTSKFKIKQPDAPAVFTPTPGVFTLGTLILKGSVCKKCKNKGSDIYLEFRDSTPNVDGNQSFTLIPIAINPPFCDSIDFGIIDVPPPFLVQVVGGIGIIKRKTGKPLAVSFTIEFAESLTPDQDDFVNIFITEPTPPGSFIPLNPFTVFIGTVRVPDKSLKVKECSKHKDNH